MDTGEHPLIPSQGLRMHVPAPHLWLVYAGEEGVVTGAFMIIRPGKHLLGRHFTELPMRDSWVSRKHAQVELRAREVILTDLESKAGTFVNGEAIAPYTERTLRDGDIIRMGNSILTFTSGYEHLDKNEIRGILGQSSAVNILRERLLQVSRHDVTVLLLGETGCGKGVAASALHDYSERAGGPFIPVNCSAIPESIADSELFGSLSGAYTGAVNRTGLFRAANHGTLFLDEIGELPISLQPKLLRAIEEKKIRPVGSTKEIDVDIRLIAATNRDLRQAVSRGTFRADLYSRLSIVDIEIPPLCERKEDILLLMEKFLNSNEPSEKTELSSLLSAELAEKLLLYTWPGNIRELRALLENLRILKKDRASLVYLIQDKLFRKSPSPRLTHDVPDAVLEASRGSPAPARVWFRASRPSEEELVRLLHAHRGVVSRVAEKLGTSRRQLVRWIEEAGLDLESFRKSA